MTPPREKYTQNLSDFRSPPRSAGERKLNLIKVREYG